MAEFDSRIAVVTKEKRGWEPLRGIDFSRFQCEDPWIVADRPWADSHILEISSRAEDRLLKKLLQEILAALGPEVLLIADSTSYDVDPYNQCYYSLGEGLREAVFCQTSPYEGNPYWEEEEDEERTDWGEDRCLMHQETKITDVAGWLRYGRFPLTEREKLFWEEYQKRLFGYLPENLPCGRQDVVQITFRGWTLPVPVSGAALAVADPRPLVQYPFLRRDGDRLTLMIDEDWGNTSEMEQSQYFLSRLEQLWSGLYWLQLYLRSDREEWGYDKLVRRKALPADVKEKEQLDALADPWQLLAESAHLLFEGLLELPRRVPVLAAVTQGRPLERIVQDVLPLATRQVQALTLRLEVEPLIGSGKSLFGIDGFVQAGFTREPLADTSAEIRRNRVRIFWEDVVISAGLYGDSLVPGGKSLDQIPCLTPRDFGYQLVLPGDISLDAGGIRVCSTPESWEKLRELPKLLRVQQRFLHAGREERLRGLPTLYRWEHRVCGRLLSTAEREQICRHPHFIESALYSICLCLDGVQQMMQERSGLITQAAQSAQKKKNGKLWKGKTQTCVIANASHAAGSACQLILRLCNENETTMSVNVDFRQTCDGAEDGDQVQAWLDSRAVWAEVSAQAPKGSKVIYADRAFLWLPGQQEEAVLLQCACARQTPDGIQLTLDLPDASPGLTVSDQRLRSGVLEVWQSLCDRGCLFSREEFQKARNAWRQGHGEPFALGNDPGAQGVSAYSGAESVVRFARFLDQVAQQSRHFLENADRMEDGSFQVGMARSCKVGDFAAYPDRALMLRSILADHNRLELELRW